MNKPDKLTTFLSSHGLVTGHDVGWMEDAKCWSCYPANLAANVEVSEQTAGLGATEEAAILDWCMKRIVRKELPNGAEFMAWAKDAGFPVATWTAADSGAFYGFFCHGFKSAING